MEGETNSDDDEKTVTVSSTVFEGITMMSAGDYQNLEVSSNKEIIHLTMTLAISNHLWICLGYCLQHCQEPQPLQCRGQKVLRGGGSQRPGLL